MNVFRIRRKVALLTCGLVVAIFLLLYVIINYQISSEMPKVPEMSYIEERLKKAENEHRQRVEKTLKKDAAAAHHQSPRDWVHIKRGGPRCSLQTDVTPVVDVQMLEVYRETEFDNPNGGVWKQGWDVQITPGRFSEENKLKVFVVPHSHNDPGWIQTFDEYYERSTKQILANMLRHLTDDEQMTFIWAEISYFSRWFEAQSKESQGRVKQLLKRKQLEFVTGGWVMPDEANSHWYSIIEQLAEGQQWLKKHLNVTPTSGWSIDPFGHSPSLAYVLKHSGFENHLIQRTHYVVKRTLARKRQLEFNWRQLYDTDGSTSLFTHMMPFYSYDVPHTCGPDPKICCQFDFKRLPGYGLTCPWHVPPQVITDQNVAQRAALVIDQWKKKAELYQSNSVLIPLGDDFRYSQSTEWEAQRQNFEKLFEYINGEPTLGVEAKFGTLQEYFDSVRRDQSLSEFPSLSGDFFTYADRDDHYWSGYYTSRPYHKRMDRVLLNYIRSAEMLHSWSKWETEAGFDKLLTAARREHSLFQHHDGITGTAKDHVVVDYTTRMEEAIKNCRHVIQQAAFRLLTTESIYQADPQFTYFSIDDSRAAGPDENRPTIILGEDLPKKYVVLHNSLPYARTEVVEFFIAKPYVIVTNADESITYSQVAPVWSWHRGHHIDSLLPQASTTKYRLMFKATVPPLGLAVYIIHAKNSAEVVSMGTTFTKTVIYTPQPFSVHTMDYPYSVEFADPRDVLVKQEGEGSVSAAFNKNGLLTSLATDTSVQNVSVSVNFLKYNTRTGLQQKSGAYLFLPGGEAQPIPLDDPIVLVSKGPIESSVSTSFSFGIHDTILRDNSVEIRNTIDINGMDNSEIVMRLSTNIDNEEVFYTDLNGLSFAKRERFSKLPLQANYYPIPTGIIIEDDTTRLTLLTAQPLGGSSLSPGELEIMQDRRLNQDDDRGLGQGVLDNRPVNHIFRLVLEQREKCRKLDASYPAAFLTPNAHMERQTLLHPMEKLIFNENEWNGIQPTFGQNHKPLQEGMEIVSLKSLSAEAKGIILHRTQLEQCESSVPDGDHETISLKKVLGEEYQSIYKAPLTFVKKLSPVTLENIDFCPMETKAFILNR
ncbi:alpha-mannosidase 2 [Culicoides brevitarsis]|uniref:alpha-mannosidase 2 n=1 Tax=Culicoides brevitarsis TaxID=469753 RepID=UPI00307C131A